MPQNQRQIYSPEPGHELLVSWSIHLARQYPLKSAFSLAVTLFASASAYWAIGPLASLGVGAVMLASLADFLWPVRYEINADGAVCKMLLKKSAILWQNVRHCYLDDLGVKLSPLDRQSRLEGFRGVYLRFADNKEQVIEAVRSVRSRVC